MEASPALEPSLVLRQQILSLSPDQLNLAARGARAYLERKEREEFRQRLLNDPNLHTYYEDAKAYLESKQKRVEKKPAGFGLKLARAAVVTSGVITVAGGTTYAERDKILELGRKIETPDVVYPNKIFVGGTEYAISLTPSPSPTPTETPTPTPEPTVDPKILAKKEVGERNAAEFFLEDLVKKFKKIRQTKFENDPEFARRIQKEFLNSNRINILYLGVDQIRGRGDSGNEGVGRSDSIMLVSFDPHTFKTITISIPRDLYSPEVARYFPSIPKINSMTMINEIPEGRDVDSNKFVKTILENATGVPVDWIIKINVDFVYSSENMGVFDDLFPNGLEINVPEDIVDVDAPLVDGKPGLLFSKGVQKMKGEKIMRYSTERRADSDFGRAQRQRQVIQASMMTLLPSIMTNLIDGNTQTLDKIVSALERQKDSFNLFYDVDLIEIIKTMRNNLNSLRSTPREIAVLGVLAANTIDKVQDFRKGKEGMFVSFGIDWQNGVMSITPADGYEGLSMLKVDGSDMRSAPLAYWDPIRKRIFDLYR